MPKKKSNKENTKGQLFLVLLLVTILFSAVSIWYATDPLWPAFTFLAGIATFFTYKKGL